MIRGQRLKEDKRLIDFKKQSYAARDRGIEWQFEYWEWLQMWEDSGHFHERGTRKGQWVMARNGDRGPYSFKNAKIVRVETNNAEACFTRRRMKAGKND